MRKVRTWLRRAWHDMAAGLVAVGQTFGAMTPPEYYGFSPYAVPPAAPLPGHPERLTPTSLSHLPAHERAVWSDLAEVWQDTDLR
ncbi:DUF6059 family protein [Streptomyces sp. NPDC012474]|uniref:DUF6059 family protein n=1 Tax=Streptomyces sp. NPDC012474 TaxID=3364836 RepID=UPI0036E97425